MDSHAILSDYSSYHLLQNFANTDVQIATALLADPHAFTSSVKSLICPIISITSSSSAEVSILYDYILFVLQLSRIENLRIDQPREFVLVAPFQITTTL